MADRYWVGGAGTWDATTTHWAASSGGTAGASVPTATDNVIFDTLSNFPTNASYAATIGTASTCLDISIAGPAANTVTITSGATAVINVYGSWLNAATGVVFSSTAGCVLNFLATTTGKTVTTNNITLSTLLVTFNGVGGYWTLGSAVTITSGASPTILAGTFDTGGFAMTLNSILSTTTTNVRAINLNTSVISCSGNGAVNLAATNLTFNAGTSTINCSGATPAFIGGGQTFYNVNFTSTTGGNTNTITGNNTFNNLNQTSPVSNRRILSVGNSQVVTGTLTLGAANAYNARVQVINTNVGSPVTLTVGTIATLADVDFRDITAAGASGTWSGTRLGNGLGNSNITFDAGKTVYWNLVAGGNWSANAWATSSGGAAATANFPLAQDTAIIDNAGLTASNTITYEASWWLGTLNSTRTAAWTFVFGGSPTMYGDFTLTTLTTTSGTANLTFIGKGATQTLTTNGVSLSSPIVQQSVGGTLLLNGSVTSTGSTGLSLTNGTVDLNGFDLTAVAFSSSNSNTRTLTQGSGSFTLTGSNATVWNTGNATNLTYTTTPTVNANYSGATGTRVFSIAGSQDRINLNITAGTDTITPVTTFSVNNYNFTGFAGTLSNVNTQVFGSLTLSTGMTVTAGTGAFTFSASSGTSTITSNGKTMDFPLTFSNGGATYQLQDALTSGATRTITLNSGTLNLNGYALTTGIFITGTTNGKILTPAFGDIFITGNNATVWNTSTSTGLTYTTTPVVVFTYAGAIGSRTVTTNAASIISAYFNSGTDNLILASVFQDLNLTYFGGTLANSTRTIYGSLSLSSTVTTTAGALITTFIRTAPNQTNIVCDGATIDFPILLNGNGTTNCITALTLGSTRALTITGGTLNLFAGVTSTVGSFVTTGTTAKYLNSDTPGTQATISAASGTQTVSYLTIKDSNATGGATWNALAITNVDAGNNTGWLFSTTPSVSNEVTMRLRSFTQPRRF